MVLTAKHVEVVSRTSEQNVVKTTKKLELALKQRQQQFDNISIRKSLSEVNLRTIRKESGILSQDESSDRNHRRRSPSKQQENRKVHAIVDCHAESTQQQRPCSTMIRHSSLRQLRNINYRTENVSHVTKDLSKKRENLGKLNNPQVKTVTVYSTNHFDHKLQSSGELKTSGRIKAVTIGKNGEQVTRLKCFNNNKRNGGGNENGTKKYSCTKGKVIHDLSQDQSRFTCLPGSVQRPENLKHIRDRHGNFRPMLCSNRLITKDGYQETKLRRVATTRKVSNAKLDIQDQILPKTRQTYHPPLVKLMPFAPIPHEIILLTNTGKGISTKKPRGQRIRSCKSPSKLSNEGHRSRSTSPFMSNMGPSSVRESTDMVSNSSISSYRTLSLTDASEGFHETPTTTRSDIQNMVVTTTTEIFLPEIDSKVF